jgi:hypothetical protein
MARTFAELTAGVAYAEQIGVDTIIERGRLAAEQLRHSSCTSASRQGRCQRRCLHLLDADA